MAERVEIHDPDRPDVAYEVVSWTNDRGECSEAEAKWLTIHAYDARGKLIEVADGIVPQQPSFARRVRHNLQRGASG